MISMEDWGLIGKGLVQIFRNVAMCTFPRERVGSGYQTRPCLEGKIVHVRAIASSSFVLHG